MNLLDKLRKQIIKEFKILQWEPTIEADAICIVNVNCDKLRSENEPRLPDWIDPVVWEEFKNHRRKVKKPMPPFAERLMIKSLAKAKADGIVPNELLEAVIVNGWQGIGNKENQYNGVYKNRQPAKYNGKFLNPEYQLNLAEKEFIDGNEHTSSGQEAGSAALRSIQHSPDRS